MTWFPLVGLALTVAVPLPKEPMKADPPSIVGVWVCETVTIDGKGWGPDDVATIEYEFTAGGKVHNRHRGVEGVGSTYTVDPSKLPGTVDWTADGTTLLRRGIYRVEKDTLTWCFFQRNDDERPTKFESPAGSQVVLITLKRLAKK